MAFTFSHINNNAAAGTSFYSLLSLLVSLGWTKTKDSDGTTYSATGTQVTHGGSGANGLANNRAWFVLKQPDSNRAVLFQRGTTTTVWRISYCADDAFTAGAPSATQVPAPVAGSVEIVRLGGGTPAAPTFAGAFASADSAYSFHACAGEEDEGYSWYFLAEDNTTRRPSGCGFFDALLAASETDPDPVVFGISGTGAPNFRSFANNDNNAASWFTTPLSSAANNRGCGFRDYNLGANALGANGFSGKDTLGPVAWSRQAATAGFKGWSRLFKHTSVITRTSMTTYNVNETRDYVVSSDPGNFVNPVVLPWDGTDPGVANFDAEIIGTPGIEGQTTYYKMQAPCTSAPGGFIQWVNTTGDDSGRPACGAGTEPSFEVDRWTV